jgi:hypothetical protein
MPPLVLPAAGEAMPNGVTVSQPLQPVQLVEPVSEAPKPPAVAEAKKPEPVGPLGSSWQTFEYLLFWPKAQPLPPLVTASRGFAPPTLCGPTTLLLAGGQPLDSPDVSGARFTAGWSLNDAQTAGLAVSYLFLGTRTSNTTLTDIGPGRTRSVGRPIFNAVTHRPDFIPVALPGGLDGRVDVSTTTRVTGWEINGLMNLYDGPQLRLNAIAGYRYFMVNEGLRVEQTNLFPATESGPPVLSSSADQFDAHNRFHGGQLGLTADFTHGSVFVEATGKVALGQAVNVVNVSGQTVAVAPGFPFPPAQYFNGGVLAQPSNSGRFVDTAFGVLPEAVVKVGYRFRDQSRFYIGYNFIYLSEAVRPGDQVDLTVDPGQVPVFARAQPGGAMAQRPAPVLARSDFWVQGLIFGLEYRY